MELLLIKSGDSQNLENTLHQNPNTWSPTETTAIREFIRKIEVPEATAGFGEQFRAMISGIPSPWARIILTRAALSVQKHELGKSVLDLCYGLFKSEWRGLVAAYVLRPDSFEFSVPISLIGPKVGDTGQFDILGIYGEMLFEETPLWVHELREISAGQIAENPPKMEILYYKKKEGNGFRRIPVGATSPYTFLFSSAGYSFKEQSIRDDMRWIDADGKFSDPTHVNEVTADELMRLIAFVHNMSQCISSPNNNPGDTDKYYKQWLLKACEWGIEGHFALNQDAVKLSITQFQDELLRWEAELTAVLREKDPRKQPNYSMPIQVAKPAGPLSLLLNKEMTLYLEDIYFYSNSAEHPNARPISSEKILIESDYLAAWESTNDPNRDLSKAPVYYIREQSGRYFFALPLTEEALGIFHHAIKGIMLGEAGIRIEAILNHDTAVDVKIWAKLDGGPVEIPVAQRTYQIATIEETSGKVFIWPDFTAEIWKKYYYYSEFPSNVSGIRMIPVFEDGEGVQDDDYIVHYPAGKVEATRHKYEIIVKDKPLSAVKVMMNKGGTEVASGTLLVKKGETADSHLLNTHYLRRLGMERVNMAAPATVGIDFGSTNTCAYYVMDGTTDLKPVPFANRRLALVGFDNPEGSLAQKDELFFISNEPSKAGNGQIKSWLHEHNMEYLTDRSRAAQALPLAGGVPVNEGNIPVNSMNERTIVTNAGNLQYNMKWLDSTENRDKKTSYMSMLWIQICADMLAGETPCYPAGLNWSFPSAMSTADVMDLRTIYRNATVFPFDYIWKNHFSRHSYTEAESVCSYAISAGIPVNPTRLSLGIDIGGSTSDILIMGMVDNAIRLLTQSSVRMAGGFFFKAITSSKRFRECLYGFHESKLCPRVKVCNIRDIISDDPRVYGRAPYYLNCIFDQLQTEDEFYRFYDYLRNGVPEVFTLPAYVTGMLVYYSGMLVRNVIEKHQMTGVQEVLMRYYGKGGRLFEWLLDVFEDESPRYFKACFAAGAGSNDIRLKIHNIMTPEIRETSRRQNKSEVAMGLVADKFFNIVPLNPNGEEEERTIENYDIVGEKGLTLLSRDGNRSLEDRELLPGDLFANRHVNFGFPDHNENFEQFIGIFTRFINKQTALLEDVKELAEGNINVLNYIFNDPEYKKYIEACEKGQEDAAYKMPILIAEALSYLEQVLLPFVARVL